MSIKGENLIKIGNDIKGLIFDCDGTLVDSMPTHWEAWLDTFAEYNLECPISYLEQHAGVPIKETLLSYLRDYEISTIIDVDEFIARKHKKSQEKMYDVRPIEEVVDVVHRFNEILPMSVASGGSLDNVLISLKAINLEGIFTIIITSNDPIPGKPNPDIFLHAAQRMNVNPEHCLVFEDGDMGIIAAQRAGMKFFDVRTL